MRTLIQYDGMSMTALQMEKGYHHDWRLTHQLRNPRGPNPQGGTQISQTVFVGSFSDRYPSRGKMAATQLHHLAF